MFSVTYFYREPRATGLSIEGIFRSVSGCLRGRIAGREFYCDPGLTRMQNTLRAGKYAGDINHITGDVNFLALGLRGKKNILTVHDLGYYENPVHSRLVKMVYRTMWFALPLRYVDIVTVVSEFTKEKLVRYFRFPEERIRVIPNPVKAIFSRAPKEIVNEPMRVLMMGTGKHKNLDGLIAAAKGGGMHLDIIGYPAADELEKLKEYGIAHTLYRNLTDEQVYDRYIACDVLYMASHYEGFGMPLIEAQAVGRPVITSNNGAMKEIGEGSAILTDPNSPADIRTAILMMKDKGMYEETVVRGYRNAAKYNCDLVADKYMAVYEELYKMSKR